MRNDSFFDAFVRRGIAQYMGNNSYYERKAYDDELTELFHNALARRIVTALVDDCVKNWLKIKGDKDDKILQYMETIDVESAFIEAGYWDRLYGRSCIFILADDGRNADEPLNYNSLRSIKGFVVYDKREILEDMSGLLKNDDPGDENFGKTEYYQILPMNGRPFVVHHSRLLMFDGETLPRRERIQNNGAGLSCLDGVIKAIRRNEMAHARAADIIERLSQSMLKLNGLSDLLMSEEGTKTVRARLDMIDMARNILNTIAIDKDDDFQLYHMNVAGVRDVIQEFEQDICGKTGYPVTILFGRSPAGMNSTGAADFENYYNAVRRYQKRKMKPLLEKLVKIIQLCKDGPTKGKELEDWQIEFEPLTQLSELEQVNVDTSKANCEKIKAETIKTLIDMQCLDATEARQYLAKSTEIVPEGELDLSDTEDKGKVPDNGGAGLLQGAEGSAEKDKK